MLIYTDLVREIVRDVAATVPGLAHLRPDAIAIAAAARWSGAKWGNLAACIGLKEKTEPTFSVWIRPRTRTAIEVSPWFRIRPVKITLGGAPCRYLIVLRLPRLLRHDPLETIVHELFHIGEAFDGLPRPMRHGRVFDGNVDRLRRQWLARGDRELIELARLKIGALRSRFGSVLARRLPSHFRSRIIERADAPCTYEEAMPRLWPRYRLASDYKVAALEYTSPRTPRRIAEEECALRLYHAKGSEDLSPAYARYVLKGTRTRRPRPSAISSAVATEISVPDAPAPNDLDFFFGRRMEGI